MNIDTIHKTLIHSRPLLLLLVFFLAACGNQGNSSANSTELTSPMTEISSEVQVSITGGHDTDPRDGGRPVVLIASALGVPPEVFREAFSHVQPAAAGQEPDPAQIKLNKSALLDVLGPYGVNNDLLDTVSNYYRFNGSVGETWPQTPATVIAIVSSEGIVTGFIITDPGSGYTSPPVINLSGSDTAATATLSFTTDFNTNGSLAAITLEP